MFIPISHLRGKYTQFCFLKDDVTETMSLSIDGVVVGAQKIEYFVPEVRTWANRHTFEWQANYVEVFKTKSWKSIGMYAYGATNNFTVKSLSVWDKIIDP